MARRGVTLIEILVVISIIVLLAAVTIPSVRPAIESRRIREAARIIEATLHRAQAEAIERQRPVGVQFVRSARQHEASVLMAVVTDMGYYSGQSFDAFARVQLWGTAEPRRIKILVTQSAIGQKILRDGDRIQFGSRGWNAVSPTWQIVDDTATPNPPAILPDFPPAPHGEEYIDLESGVTTTTDAQGRVWITSHVLTAFLVSPAGPSFTYPIADANGNQFPSGRWSDTTAFVVWRRPQIVGGPSVGLPQGTVIDLYESGTHFVSFAGTGPVTILFGKSGGVHEVAGVSGVSTGDSVFLLVTNIDRIPGEAAAMGSPRNAPQGEEGDPQRIDIDPQNRGNLMRAWRDPRSLWVAVRPKHGTILTTDVASVDLSAMPTTITPAGPFNYAEAAHRCWGLKKSRSLAVEPTKGL